MLGVEFPQVEKALTDRVMRHFREEIENGTPVLVCPALIEYRKKLDEKHAKQSAGGKQSAARINNQRKNSQPDSYPDRRADSSLSREERKGEERKGVSLENESLTSESREWLADYDGPALHEADWRKSEPSKKERERERERERESSAVN